MGWLHCPTPIPIEDANADTDSCTEEVAIDVNEMLPRLVLNGYRTCLGLGLSPGLSENTSEHYH